MTYDLVVIAEYELKRSLKESYNRDNLKKQM